MLWFFAVHVDIIISLHSVKKKIVFLCKNMMKYFFPKIYSALLMIWDLSVYNNISKYFLAHFILHHLQKTFPISWYLVYFHLLAWQYQIWCRTVTLKPNKIFWKFVIPGEHFGLYLHIKCFFTNLWLLKKGCTYFRFHNAMADNQIFI